MGNVNGCMYAFVFGWHLTKKVVACRWEGVLRMWWWWAVWTLRQLELCTLWVACLSRLPLLAQYPTASWLRVASSPACLFRRVLGQSEKLGEQNPFDSVDCELLTGWLITVYCCSTEVFGLVCMRMLGTVAALRCPTNQLSPKLFSSSDMIIWPVNHCGVRWISLVNKQSKLNCSLTFFIMFGGWVVVENSPSWDKVKSGEVRRKCISAIDLQYYNIVRSSWHCVIARSSHPDWIFSDALDGISLRVRHRRASVLLSQPDCRRLTCPLSVPHGKWTEKRIRSDRRSDFSTVV